MLIQAMGIQTLDQQFKMSCLVVQHFTFMPLNYKTLVSLFVILFGFVFTSCSNISNLTTRAHTENGLPLQPTESALTVSNKLQKSDKHGYKTYPDSVRTRVVRTTSYSHQENEVGAPGRKNCIGGILKYGPEVRSAAADWSVYPVGTKFRVAGLPQIFIVDDYGSALAGTNTIDIYHPTLSLMRKWATKKAEITIIQFGDYDRSLRILSKRKKYHHCNKMYVNLKKRIQKGEVSLSLADND